MSRLARFFLVSGAGAIVLGFGMIHAARFNYSFSGTARFSWSMAFLAVLVLAAYGFGLPDLPRSGREAMLLGAGAALVAAGVISFAQLFVGDALLPRFVVFCSSLTVIPWYGLSWRVAWRGRQRAESRDR